MGSLLIINLTEPIFSERIAPILREYHHHVTIADTNTKQLLASLNPDAVLVLMGENWQSAVQADDAQRQLLEDAIQQTGLYILPIFCAGTTIDANTLPPGLRSLGYMTGMPLENAEDAAEIDLIARSVTNTLHRQTADSTKPTTQGRNVPTNLLIIAAVLIFGFVLVILATLQRDSDSAGNNGVLPEAESTAVVASTEIMIGLAADFSGEAAARGIEMEHGVKLALAQRPTIQVEGHAIPVQLLSQDTRCSSINGRRVAELFTASEDITAVIGPVCNISCAATAQVFEAAGLINISPACTDPNLADSTTFFRTVPAETAKAAQAVAYLQKTQPAAQIVVVHDEQVSGRHLAEAFQATYTTDGAALAGFFAVESSSLDIEALAESIRELNPNIVYFAGRATTAASLRASLPQVTLFLALDTTAEAYLAELENTATVVDGNTLTLRLLPPAGDAVDALTLRYSETYAESPTTPVYLYAYDAAQMLLDALEATTTWDATAQAPIVDQAALLIALQNYAASGVTGELKCVDGNCGASAFSIETVRDGLWQPLS